MNSTALMKYNEKEEDKLAGLKEKCTFIKKQCLSLIFQKNHVEILKKKSLENSF